MSAKEELVAAAEAVLVAARAAPDERLGSREEVIAALKRYDAAESRLDDAIDAYMLAARQGTKP